MKLTIEKVGKDGFIVEYLLSVPMTVSGFRQKKIFIDKKTMIEFVEKIIEEDN